MGCDARWAGQPICSSRQGGLTGHSSHSSLVTRPLWCGLPGVRGAGGGAGGVGGVGGVGVVGGAGRVGEGDMETRGRHALRAYLAWAQRRWQFPVHAPPGAGTGHPRARTDGWGGWDRLTKQAVAAVGYVALGSRWRGVDTLVRSPHGAMPDT